MPKAKSETRLWGSKPIWALHTYLTAHVIFMTLGCNSGGAVQQTEVAQEELVAAQKDGAPSTCLQAWRANAPCGAFCVGQTQADHKNCQAFLDCYQRNNCGPGTCGGPDQVCGVNRVTPKMGSAPKALADLVYECIACPGTTPTVSCSGKINTTPCTDRNACTVRDTCQNNWCISGAPVTCTALDQCHDAGTCDALTGICSNPFKAEGALCDDQVPCTFADSCNMGTCIGKPVVCTALDQCHDAGTCDALTGICSNPSKADGTECNDQKACTFADACSAGTCVGKPIVCMALDQCHDAGTCDVSNGICSNPAKVDGTACDDQTPCTTSDACTAGTCVGQPVVCLASDSCHAAGTCDPTTGMCLSAVLPDGTGCDDADPCTEMGTCQAGACVGANPVACAGPDQCHDVGSCDPLKGGCVYPNKPDGLACDDGNVCTQTDTCLAGVCVGSNPLVCTATDQCHDAGICDPAALSGLGRADWSKRYDRSLRSSSNPMVYDNQPRDLVVDESRNAYVLVSTSRLPASVIERSGILLRYGADGNERVIADTGEATSMVRRGGNLFTVGAVHYDYSVQNPADILVEKFSVDGTKLWSNYANRGYRDDWPLIVVDRSENVYVTYTSQFEYIPAHGYTAATLADELAVAKYDRQGALQWVKYPWRRVSASTYGSPRATSLAVDTTGNLLVSGTDGTLKFGPDGSVICSLTDSGQVAGLPDGGFVLSTHQGGTWSARGISYIHSDLSVLAYDSMCQQRWSAVYDYAHDEEDGQAVLVSSDGSVFVVTESCNHTRSDASDNRCLSNRSFDIAVIRYGADGSRHWVKRLAGMNPVRAVLNASGQVVLAGLVTSAVDARFVITALNATTGEQSWSQQLTRETANSISGPFIAASSDSVYVAVPMPSDWRLNATMAHNDVMTTRYITIGCTNPAKTDGTSCNDGDACTLVDACQAGSCIGGNPVVCAEPDQCHDQGSCDPATGICANPNKPDGVNCNDGNACTWFDNCTSGVCEGQRHKDCSAPDSCHEDGTCDPATGQCTNPTKADGVGCTDPVACLQGTTTCHNGACTGQDGMTCAQRDALLQRFIPTLLFSDDGELEPYRPARWQWLFAKSRLINVAQGELLLDSTEMATTPERILDYADVRSGVVTDDIWVVPAEEARHGEQWSDVQAGAGIYGHVSAIDDRLVNIEYWMLYGYNDVGASVDDWNHDYDLTGIQLVYDRKYDRIMRAAYGLHGKIQIVYEIPPDVPTIDLGGAVTWKIPDSHAYFKNDMPAAMACEGPGNWVQMYRGGASGLPEHIAVFVEWGTHEPWPRDSGSCLFFRDHGGRGLSFIPAHVTQLTEADAPFVYFNGIMGGLNGGISSDILCIFDIWCTDDIGPKALMRHKGWYNPIVSVPGDRADIDPYQAFGNLAWPPRPLPD